MRLLSAVRALLVLIVVSASAISAQSSQSVSSQSVPRLINISGVFRPANGQPASAVETVTLSIYADPEGGAPLWQETQTIALDGAGPLRAAARRDPGGRHSRCGVWHRRRQVAGHRVRARRRSRRAARPDHQRPVCAARRPMPTRSAAGPPPRTCSRRAPAAPRTRRAAADEAGGVTADVVLPGTPNFLAKYVNGADVGNSGVFEAADGAVGMGTTTPFDRLHVRYTNTTGEFTGLAVQNLNGGAFAYSGMLFYDHTGALAQFQGFNNATHEYRINNIARVSPGGAFNGSINFMLGGASKFIVAPTATSASAPPRRRRSSKSAMRCPAGPRTCG